MPQLQTKPERVPLSRNRIMLESGLLTVFAWFVVLVAMSWFDAGGPGEGAAKAVALLFTFLGLISLVRFLYGFLAVNETRQTPSVQHEVVTPKSVKVGPTQAALPPEQSLPLSDYPLRPNTREILRQPSVTEHTTRLLDEQSLE